MIGTLALCLSLHTSGPVALAARLTDGAALSDTQTVKPGLEIPPRGQPGHGGGPF